jgi:hypothetical protein
MWKDDDDDILSVNINALRPHITVYDKKVKCSPYRPSCGPEGG